MEEWVKLGNPECPLNLYGCYSVSSLHAAWDPLYFVFRLAIYNQPLSCSKKPLSSWSHDMNAVFSPGFFEGIVGGWSRHYGKEVGEC